MDKEKSRSGLYRLRTARNQIGHPVTMSDTLDGCLPESEVAMDESISYQTGYGRPFRPCSARKSWVERNPYPIAGYSPSFGLTIRRDAETGKYSATVGSGDAQFDERMYFAGPRGHTVYVCPSSDDISDAISDTQVGLASSPVRIGMNIPQAIIELKDVRRTVKTVANVAGFLMNGARGALSAKRLGNLGREARKIANRSLNRWQRLPLRQVVDGYLSYVFGVVPTYRDFSQFIDEVVIGKAGPSIRKQDSFSAGDVVRCTRTLRSPIPSRGLTTTYSGSFRFNWEFPWLPEGESRTLYRTFTDLCGLNIQSTSDLEVANAWPSMADTHLVQDVHRITSFGRVWKDVEFKQRPPLIQGADLTSTAWELIPFSFVVDWFANLGKWLRQENRLAIARQGGFYLDPGTGIWLGHRVERCTWVPQLEAAFSVNVTAGTPVDGGRRYVPCDVSFVTHRHVEYVKQTVERSYTRTRVSDSVRCARLNTRGFTDQGPFQWVTGVALAISNCEALRRL